MGQSANGVLVYGYDLGGDEEWKVQGAGEFGEPPAVDWFDPDDEEGDHFQAAAQRRLLAEIAGFAEEWSAGDDGYFDREKAAKARVGVEFVTYCSHDYPMYVLAAKAITVDQGYVNDIDMAGLVQAPAREGWDEKLRAAIAALGLTPTQEQAKWLLVSRLS